MKNQWIKFKHWLIKKLGGHVTLPVAPKIEYHNETPITICANIKVNEYDRKQDANGLETHVKRILATKIMQEILEKDLLEVVAKVNPIYFEITYEARIRILRK